MTPEIRIGWNAYGLHLQDRRMPAKSFADLKKLFLVDVPLAKEDEVLLPHEEPQIANTAPVLATGAPNGS